MRNLSQRLSLSLKHFFSYFGKLRRVRSGNRISRVFRIVFEHKRVRGVLGTNLALALMASSMLPHSAEANILPENTIISVGEVSFNTEHSVVYPLREIKMTQGYYIFHSGIDLDGITGDPVNPIMNGKVKDIQYSRFAYGKAIIIDHGNGFESLYAHLSKIEVEKGQEVDTSTRIGKVGSTGRAFGDHLHLEVYMNGKNINPLSILPTLNQR